MIGMLVLCEYAIFRDRVNDILECNPSGFRQVPVLLLTEPKVYASMYAYCAPFINPMVSCLSVSEIIFMVLVLHFGTE